MEAMKQPTIRVVAVIAEGVPEADTKKLIAYARKHNKILIGPATVGGVQVSSIPARSTHLAIDLTGMCMLAPRFIIPLPKSCMQLRCAGRQVGKELPSQSEPPDRVRVCIDALLLSAAVSLITARPDEGNAQ